ncbi:MAG: PEP-CTERM sorting domain-containing protein [Betaproteobacteria bacterium]
MQKRKFKRTAVAIALAFAASGGMIGARAAVLMDFEGIADFAQVANFYNNGLGGNFGVQFSGNLFASIDSSDGGSGNFENEPSPSTAIFAMSETSPAVMDVPAGFTTGLSFYYASGDKGAGHSVRIYDAIGGAAGGGNLLATIPLEVTSGTPICPESDALNFYACWRLASATFSGIARSVDFDQTYAQAILYDNVAIAVPEPSTYALLLAGLAGLAGIAKRRGRIG